MPMLTVLGLMSGTSMDGVDAVTAALGRVAAEGAAGVTAAIAEMDALDARVTDRETLLRGVQ